MKKEIEAVLFMARSAARYRRPAIIVAWTIFVFGVIAVLLLPDKYESKAQIYVDTSTVLKPLLQGIAVGPGSEVEQEADVLRRALLARPTIERVAKETGYINRVKDPNNAEAVDKLLTRLVDNIGIGGDPRLHVYSISFTDRDPVMARNMVQHLLDSFVKSAASVDQDDTQNAQRFLEQQVAEYAKRLSESDHRLAEFKKRYMGLMPTERGDFFQRRLAERQNLNRLESELAVALNQREELSRQITGRTGDAAVPVELPTPEQIQAATSIDVQLREHRRQLDELLLKYTERHPDVIALRETIARLEERRALDLGSVRATTSNAQPGGGVAIDNVLQQLQIQLSQVDVQIASLRAQIAQARERVNEIEASLAAGPEVEAELQRLTRDYGVTKAQYEQLLQRLESAKVSSQADSSADFKFRIVDAPRVPERPSGPKRGIFLGMVLMASCGTGLALALLLSLAKPVFMGQSELAEATGLRVLGVVGRALTQQELARRKRDFLLSATACVLLVMTAGAMLFVAHPSSQFLRNTLRLNGP